MYISYLYFQQHFYILSKNKQTNWLFCSITWLFVLYQMMSYCIMIHWCHVCHCIMNSLPCRALLNCFHLCVNKEMLMMSTLRCPEIMYSQEWAPAGFSLPLYRSSRKVSRTWSLHRAGPLTLTPGYWGLIGPHTPKRN